MNKRVLNVSFQFFWADFNPESNYFIEILKQRFEVRLSQQPDFIFFCVFDKNWPGAGNPISMPTPYGDGLKIFFTPENCRPDFSRCDFAISSDFPNESTASRSFRMPVYRRNSNLDCLFGPRRPIAEIMMEKIHFCNFVYSNEIELRNTFFDRLSHYKHIDAPGKCRNNCPPIGAHLNPHLSRFAKDKIREKLDFIRPYKFSIAFENSSFPGYTTEKIVDPMMVDSVPIYFGHPAISSEFNPNTFINFHDFDDMDALVEHVIRVDQDPDLYASYLKEPFVTNPNEFYSDADFLEWFESVYEAGRRHALFRPFRRLKNKAGQILGSLSSKA